MVLPPRYQGRSKNSAPGGLGRFPKYINVGEEIKSDWIFDDTYDCDNDDNDAPQLRRSGAARRVASDLRNCGSAGGPGTRFSDTGKVRFKKRES